MPVRKKPVPYLKMAPQCHDGVTVSAGAGACGPHRAAGSM